MSGCKECGRRVGKGNTSGRCQRCANAAQNGTPEFRALVSAGLRRTYATDPVKRQACRERMLKARLAPGARDKRRASVLENRIWVAGNAAMPAGSEPRMRAGARGSATKLAWCPPHLRDEYRFITQKKRLPAAEARAMIEAQHELEMARWRRSVGITQEQLEAAVPKELTPLDHAIAIAAKRFRVSAEEIMGAGRKRRQTRARFALTAAMRRADMPYLTIAKALGRTDHSSAMHWASQADTFAARDTKFARVLAELVLCWQPLEEAA